MAEDKAKKYIAFIRAFCGLGAVCFLVGFFIAASSTNNVFIGIAVILVGTIMALAALVPTLKLVRLQKEQKENRIKQIEIEVELLKKKTL